MSVKRLEEQLAAAHTARVLYGQLWGLHDKVRGIGIRETGRRAGLSPMRVQRLIDRLGGYETAGGIRLADLALIAHVCGVEIHAVSS